MKKVAVVYKTKYGSAKKYAEYIKEELSCDLFELDDAKHIKLSDYDVVIYGGGVHAGGIRGFDTFEKLIKKYSEVKYIIFACGMNVQNFEARAELRDVNFSKKHTKGLTCFYFDGKFEPENLKGLDKGIINWTKKLIKEKGLNMTKDDKALLEKIENGFDGVDKTQIINLCNAVKELINEG